MRRAVVFVLCALAASVSISYLVYAHCLQPVAQIQIRAEPPTPCPQVRCAVANNRVSPSLDALGGMDGMCAERRRLAVAIDACPYCDALCADEPTMNKRFTTKLSELLVVSPRLGDPHALYDWPRLSLVLQYFRHPANIDPIVTRLYRCREAAGGLELLVNVDSSEPADVAGWLDAANRTRGFVVPVFNMNVHEIRGYNRLAAMARGELVVFLQDDDIPPESCDWLERTRVAFDALPSLAVIGMKKGAQRVDSTRWAANASHFVLRMPSPAPGAPPPLDPPIRLQFVAWVDFSPYAVRRAAFVALGGLDERFSPPGESGIFSDVDFALRAWHAGWRVAMLGDVPREQRGPAWTQHTEEGRESRARGERRNSELLKARFTRTQLLGYLYEEIQRANNELLSPVRSGEWGSVAGALNGEFLFDGEVKPE